MKKVLYTSLFWIIVVGWFALYMKRFDQDLWNQISNFLVDKDDITISVETGAVSSPIVDLPLISTWVRTDDQYTVLLEKIDLLQAQIMLIQESLIAPEKTTTSSSETKTTSTNPTLEEIQRRLELLEKDK